MIPNESPHDASPLESVIETYLEQGISADLLTFKSAVADYLNLVGKPGLSPPFGYVRFLKACGISNPLLKHVDEEWVGRYWDFLTQHEGSLQIYRAMQSLRKLWEWSKKNGYLSSEYVPQDLILTPKPSKKLRTRFRILVKSQSNRSPI